MESKNSSFTFNLDKRPISGKIYIYTRQWQGPRKIQFKEKYPNIQILVVESKQITIPSPYCRDVNETLGSETETFDFQSETRPRPRPRRWEAETETFFETFALWVTLNNLCYFLLMEMEI